MEPKEPNIPGRCARCLAPMTTRLASFFKDEVICMQCVDEESEVIAALKLGGAEPATYAGCGYLPGPSDLRHKVS